MLSHVEKNRTELSSLIFFPTSKIYHFEVRSAFLWQNNRPGSQKPWTPRGEEELTADAQR